MTTVLQHNNNAKHNTLYTTLELSNSTWKVGFHNTVKLSSKTIGAGDIESLELEIELAKKKLNCADDCIIRCCYEAGRDGFWIHRALVARGIENIVIDSASIEVSRKNKRAKTDNIDVKALLMLLMRYHSGETSALSVVRVPSVEAEDARLLSRERDRLVRERGSHSARIKSKLVLHGIRFEKMSEIEGRTEFMSPGGYKLGPNTVEEIQREVKRYNMAFEQIKAIEAEQARLVKEALGKAPDQIRMLMALKGVGLQFSFIMTNEFFSWREFKNVGQVGSCAGMTPTPYDSGDSKREQGICKAGNKRIRSTMIEAAWMWLRWQPQSALSQWFERRFAHGGKRMRRIGIVAMARKLLVSLWKYLEHGVLPEGAVLGGEFHSQ
jgi:transposase